ncbi:hypothetical protein B0H19DRAFT_1316521, partial [Mycena capillaripes]
FITPDDAKRVFGDVVTRTEGFSVIVYDPAELMKDFYHWFGEILLGAWRVYSHIIISQPYESHTQPPNHLPFPQRFILPFTDNDEQPDLAGKHSALMRAMFPNTAIESAGYWDDLKQLGTTVVFDRVMLVNRNAAYKHPSARLWSNMIAGAMNVTVMDHFWSPLRGSLWRSMILYKHNPEILLSPDMAEDVWWEWWHILVVTYISRQRYDRRLAATDHEALLAGLRALEAEGICKVRVAVLEEMPLMEQVELMTRSAILIGVHGSGLTHQLWMRPGTTVIEIVIPDGYSFDYEILSRNMGLRVSSE